jgi:hypothetical protein
MSFRNKSKSLPGRVNEGLGSFKESPPGTHCLMVYPDLMTLRGIYSHYTKIQLEDNNEIVLILPYYKTTNMVRLALSRGNVYSDTRNHPFGYSGIDVNKYENEGTLIIMDSLKGYFPSEEQSSFHDNYDNLKEDLDLMSYLRILLKQAERQGKNGVTVLSDLGSFYHYNSYGNRRLIEYEGSLPKKYDGMNLKGFCLYHQKDFERQFSQEQQTLLLSSHSENIILEDAC